MTSLKVIVGCIALGAIGSGALAQNEPPARAAVRPLRTEGGGQPGRPAPLSPEKAKAAWELEATGVAKRLGLDEAKTKSLVKAYCDARASHDTEQEKVREKLRAGNDAPAARGGGAETMKAMQELNKSEREKFEKAVTGVLSAEQMPSALASLGSFTRQWDQIADAVSALGAEAAKQQQALEAVEEWVVAQAKIRGQAGSESDRQAITTANAESRQKLTDSLKKALTEEQFKKLEPALPGGGRGRGGRPQGGGGGEGGGGGGGGGGF